MTSCPSSASFWRSFSFRENPAWSAPIAIFIRGKLDFNMLVCRAMRWSKSFLPTLRESPAGPETIGEKLLVRAGFLRAISAGVYGYLPLGMRSLARIQAIARAECSAIGGQEVWLEATAAA